MSRLLQEDAFGLLQEDGFNILLDGGGSEEIRAVDVRLVTDENGSLIVEPSTAGTPGVPKQFQNLKFAMTAGRLMVAEQAEGIIEGPKTPFANLPICVDENSALQVGVKTAGALRTRRTPLGNLKVRTDENGYLLVAFVAVGVLFSHAVPLLNAMCKTDENGYLIVADGS